MAGRPHSRVLRGRICGSTCDQGMRGMQAMRRQRLQWMRLRQARRQQLLQASQWMETLTVTLMMAGILQPATLRVASLPPCGTPSLLVPRLVAQQTASLDRPHHVPLFSCQAADDDKCVLLWPATLLAMYTLLRLLQESVLRQVRPGCICKSLHQLVYA